MDNTNSKKKQILRLFGKEKCWTMKDICQSLNYSVRSAQRLLKDNGYYSSFTHNGKWYTLRTIPEFDDNGLWFHHDIGFSRWRTLTATMLYFIEHSTYGLTANDLSNMLSTSCPPLLNRIHKADKINRVKTPRGFVYISKNPTIKDRQLNRLDKEVSPPRLSDADTITILVEFIRNQNQTFEKLILQLKRKSDIHYSADIIKSLFVRLGLEKKILEKPKKSS